MPANRSLHDQLVAMSRSLAVAVRGARARVSPTDVLDYLQLAGVTTSETGHDVRAANALIRELAGDGLELPADAVAESVAMTGLGLRFQPFETFAARTHAQWELTGRRGPLSGFDHEGNRVTVRPGR